jgi:4-aminobutyrate aminotransferase/(S)-3-amino-2-methylpropionate transaminase
MEVKIKTTIPGPKSCLLMDRRSKSVAKGHGTVCNVYIKKANGAILTDVDENIFIDFAGGDHARRSLFLYHQLNQ